MVLINRKEDCSGCGACEQICPKCCIKLVSDSEGYLYPQVDIKNCVNCRLCEQVCPVKNPDKPHKPLNVYAAKNKDDIVRYNSSSGGIFTIIAEKVLAKGGIVFGVRFDKDYNVIFDHTVTTNDLENFRRSKYVQAKLGNAYKHVKTFLSQKRLVLFTGTPCQIAGLRHFLRKDYDNLILVDLICEGVPSPKVWNRYLSEEISRLCKKYSTQTLPLTKKNIAIENISFRDKIIGWKEFSFKIEISAINDMGKTIPLPAYINRDSAYMNAMFRNLDLRPICYECPFKKCKSQSDITIADYWGIDKLHPEIFDNKGTSMIYINTSKAYDFISFDKLDYIETSYEEAQNFNNIETSSKRHPYRDRFFHELDRSRSVISLLEKYRFTKCEILRMHLRAFLPEKIYRKLVKIWKTIKK